MIFAVLVFVPSSSKLRKPLSETGKSLDSNGKNYCIAWLIINKFCSVIVKIVKTKKQLSLKALIKSH
jgi:hypothetical protein